MAADNTVFKVSHVVIYDRGVFGPEHEFHILPISALESTEGLHTEKARTPNERSTKTYRLQADQLQAEWSRIPPEQLAFCVFSRIEEGNS